MGYVYLSEGLLKNQTLRKLNLLSNDWFLISLGNIISSEGIDPQNLKVSLKISRDNKVVFNGDSNTSEMKRNVYELVDWLQRSNDLPDVAVLMTGTGIIPPQDFTLKENDIVEIQIEKIGVLRNKIVLVWFFPNCNAIFIFYFYPMSDK